MTVKNINELKEFINNNLGNDYILLNKEYKNTRSILNIKHASCNKTYNVIAYNILKEKPTKCPYCFGHIKNTFENIKEKFNDFNNGEFEVISGDYINNKSILTFKHKKCNNLFQSSVNSLLTRNKKCPYCNPLKSLTTKEFKKKVGNEYEVLGEYVNNSTKIKMKHKKCSNIFEVTPQNFYRKINKCPYCGKNNKKNTDIFKYEVKTLVGNEYEVLGEYVNNSTKIKMKHNVCNNIYEVRPSNFSLGYRCPICAVNKQKLTNDEFLKRVKDLVKDEYTPLSDYNNYETKINFIHNKCKNIFKMTPHHFLSGERCPFCKNNFIGEERIKKWLEGNQIEFERQFSFKDLYDKSPKYPLKFDFKLEYTDGTYLFIEFDGKQHFENWHFGNLEDYQRRDKLKNEYCHQNNYDLLRITYKDFNSIEKILSDFFKERS